MKSTKSSSVIDDGFASVAEACKYLSLSRSTIYMLMDSNALLYARMGRTRRIPWAVLRQYAEASMVVGV